MLLWDNAGYHVGGGLVVPENVSLIGLLPYSPELNPVENLWHYLRSHHWSHRVYPDYEALRDAAAESWRAVCLDPEKIRSICAAPYLNEQMILPVRMRPLPKNRPGSSGITECDGSEVPSPPDPLLHSCTNATQSYEPLQRHARPLPGCQEF